MLVDWLLALAPILLVLLLMLGLRWKGTRAGPAGWLAAVLIAALRFGAGWQVLAWAQLKGLLLALWVLYIIWAALLFYRVTDEAGVITTVGADLPRLTADRALQVLLLGWAFGSFLQGVSGFGVPVAVLGPLLVGLGFPPVAAVVIPSIGHSWAVTFGSLGSSFYALMAATGRPGEELAAPAAAMLGLTCLLCGAGVLWAAGGPRTLRQGVAPLLVVGLAMAGAQYLVVTHGLWSIGGMSGGLAGLGVGVLWARWRNGRSPRGTAPPPEEGSRGTDPATRMRLGWALFPYALLVIIVLLAELVGPVNTFLGQVVLRVQVPELATARGWTTPAGAARTINVFGHAGALLVYASLLTFVVFKQRGYCPTPVARRIARDVVRRAVPSSIGIATMVGMAVTMDHAGMTHLLAEGISRVVGIAFPLASPFIGALGAFMTGSNTNSNVVFGALQERVATLVGMSPLLALAAQTAGGAIGGMFAPAKVIVGCAPAGADEGTTMRQTMIYGTVILAVLAGVTAAVALT
jgi:lactate permease